MIRSLEELNSLRIPRCLFLNENNVVRTELHTFCDVSEEAFVTAVYTMNTYSNESNLIKILIAKTKLAPKKLYP